jgi:hypothetical protein
VIVSITCRDLECPRRGCALEMWALGCVEEQDVGVKARALSEGALDLDSHGVIVFTNIDPPDANRDDYSITRSTLRPLAWP